MRARFLGLTGTAVSVMTGLVLGAGQLASAAPAHVVRHRPAWRIVKIFRNCGTGDSMQSATAVSADDVWAVGEPNFAPLPCWVSVEHWDGSGWHLIPVPRNTDLGFTFSPPVAATSATDAWIFPAVFGHIGQSYYQYNQALRWNGSRWHTSRFPVDLIISSAIAVNRSQIWAFGQYYGKHRNLIPYAARYNGRSWHRASVPVEPVATLGPAPGGMWAFGPTLATAGRPVNKQVLLLMRWNGRSWRTLRLPRIRAPKADDRIGAAYLAAAGPSNVWIAYQAGDSSGGARVVLLHWDRRRWYRITLPRTSAGLDGMSVDGRGGIWLLTGVFNPSLNGAWFHFHAGVWTSQPVPAPRGYNSTIFGMTWVPGTTSALAVGEADSNTQTRTVGVVYRYPR